MSRLALHPHDADDDDSSSTDSERPYSVTRIPKRSATVSPSTRSLRHHPRRRSACNLYGSGLLPPVKHRPPSARRSGTRERSAGRSVFPETTRLRKTNSEPSVEIGGQEFDIDAIRQLLDSLPRLAQQAQRASHHRQLSPSSEEEELLEDVVYAGIEELRDAALSIKSLQRVLKNPQSQDARSDPSGCFSDDASTNADSTDGRMSGISTRLGSHPRGVMQFLPNIRTESTTEDSYRNRKPLMRKTSAPESYVHLNVQSPFAERRNEGAKSPRRRAVCDELHATRSPVGSGEPIGSVVPDWTRGSAGTGPGGGRGSAGEGEGSVPEHRQRSVPTASAASLSRFSQLLKRLGGSPDRSPSPRASGTLSAPDADGSSASGAAGVGGGAGSAPLLSVGGAGGAPGGARAAWSPYAYEDDADEVARTDTPLLEADVMLWRKRSRASLRRHSSVRSMAARELFDTEKSFVEGLEYLVQKYMRPLRQPLEATLIEAGLVDKIFYRIPEVLAHHQVLLANLSARIESWHKDTIIGDVLLAHFSKQSMIETYIGFVDNFQHAKSAITQARTKPSFEKYYNRCCRDHRNKLDLDSMLISPIQRVPRYELIIKQLLKHTPVYHADHERLLRAQKHVHHLATSINRHRQANEQAEQRLMEIEAIVDGLDDLVSAGRSFVRYDFVTMQSTDGPKQRCIFTFTDLLVLTSVKRRTLGRTGKILVGQSEYLDANRFQFLIKIALDDVEIAKDTLAILHETETAIEEVKEDVKVLQKMSELANLLRSANRDKLSEMLSDMETTNAERLRTLNDQLLTNPDLTTVVMTVMTSSGAETVPIEFNSAEKRAIWESAFREAKNSLVNSRSDSSQCLLKSIVAHQTRPGLHFCDASVVPGKRADSTPFVWACTTDRFQGQVAVVSLDGGDPSIESCAGIGNAAVTAVCTVPPPSKAMSRKRRANRIDTRFKQEQLIVDLPSGSADSSSSEDESFFGGTATSTVWIGNDDGEVFVLNSTERVRTRPRERVARLGLPVDAIAAIPNCVFVSASKGSDVRILAFRPNNENGWDLEHPTPLPVDFYEPIRSI
ncbi:hypothetical protein PENTCL1PPCAC_12755, partial [Pristionchus entomophagus]